MNPYEWRIEDKPTPEGNYSIIEGGNGGTQVAVAVTKEIAELIVKLARNAPDGKCTDYCDACGEGVSH